MIPMTNDSGSYLTVKRESRARITVGRCRFLAAPAPARSEDEARSFIRKLREEFPDATHHVYAYRIGGGKEVRELCSDDREPAGTGGPPVLGVLRKAGISDTVMVVTRYFGGVKLGIRGLIKAYRAAAAEGLNSAEVRRKVPLRRVLVHTSYESLGQVLKLISSRKGEVFHVDYGEEVTVECFLQPGEGTDFARELHDYTRGTGRMEEKKGGW